ncbi:tripartite tricarboxylate transporter permease [Endozoicomonas elysicola]|uniref:C4-dicarboxylate ABC transporter permease n=1 Tax=Endozoicomonas elysicola TaxID=305900 RepID=A0A081KBF2_9GAMM|nr:tripartite tricarboxylate transporter permease [Endozoicomonas elysicola]KEI71478.1 C4-dicarboxylate ABC transporter permease [Endozoicomonas elysicola]
MFELLLQGLQSTLQPSIFLLLLAGVTGGIIIGSLPGLTATMGVAIMLPFTFGMGPNASLAMLIGVYVGAIYGGSIPAILLRTPGTPASAATVLDGHQLVQQGHAAKALSISVVCSFMGGLISTIMLITLSPMLAGFALKFSAPEYFMLAVFGLTIIGSISSKSLVKGLISGFIGLAIACIGLDPITSTPRYTFGIMELYNGLSIIPVLIGLFAISECLLQSEQIVKEASQKALTFSHKLFSYPEFRKFFPSALKSSLMGTCIGAVPGAGADIAAFVCYNEARRSSKNPENFGKGALEGIAAAESGNNGVTGGALVPLLTLGVPGDAVAAILLGALTIQGIAPGPMLFQNSPDIVYGLFSSMLVANILMLIVGLAGIKIFCRIVEIPKALIIPMIALLSVVGAYSMNNSMFDVAVALTFGLLGYLLTKIEIPLSPIVLAVILGPMAETNLRKSLMMYEGSWSFLYDRPIVLIFVLLSALSLYSTWRIKRRIQSNTSPQLAV